MALVGAALLFELTHNLGNGHCFIPREKLAAVTAELISVEPEDADERIGELIEEGQLCYEEIAGVRACYLPELYAAETNAAEIFARMSKRSFHEHFDTDKLLSLFKLLSSVSDNSTLKALAFLTDHYDDVMVGFELKR